MGAENYYHLFFTTVHLSLLQFMFLCNWASQVGPPNPTVKVKSTIAYSHQSVFWKENITTVRKCPDIAILNSHFGFCLVVFLLRHHSDQMPEVSKGTLWVRILKYHHHPALRQGYWSREMGAMQRTQCRSRIHVNGYWSNERYSDVGEM